MILVTGAFGFIGSNLVYDLVYHGHEVVMVDNNWNSQWNVSAKLQNLAIRLNKPVPKAELIELEDRNAVNRLFRTYNIDTVVHLADVNVPYHQNPMFDHNVNVIGTGNLLLHHANLKAFIMGSTTEVYAPDARVISESLSPYPWTQYGSSKLVSERLVEAYGRAHRLYYGILRMANVGGNIRHCPMIQQPRRSTSLLRNCFRVAAGLEPELLIRGEWPALPDGTAVRDYIHVEDVVRAIRSAMMCVSYEMPELVCNIGTGVGHSVFDVMREYAHVAGAPIPYRLVDKGVEAIAYRVAEVKRAYHLNNWRPTHDLHSICQTHWESQQGIKHEQQRNAV